MIQQQDRDVGGSTGIGIEFDEPVPVGGRHCLISPSENELLVSSTNALSAPPAMAWISREHYLDLSISTPTLLAFLITSGFSILTLAAITRLSFRQAAAISSASVSIKLTWPLAT